MPSLLVGASGSYVGEAVVGGPAAFYAVGSLAFTGTAGNKKVSVKATSGLAVFSGAATNTQGRIAVSSGLVSFNGAAGKSIEIGTVGQVVFSGAASATYVGVSYVYRIANGSLAFSGASVKGLRSNKQAGGDLVFAANAAVARLTVLGTSGTLAFSGVSTARLVTPFIPTGGVIFTGTVVFTRARNTVPSGVLSLIGAASKSVNQVGASVWNENFNGATESTSGVTSVWNETAPTGVGSIVSSNNGVWGG